MENDYFANCTWKEIPDICMIELTNSCNFSCVMCSNKLMSRKKGFMTIETFKKTLDSCAEANIQNIKLYTTGESLLHPRILDFWRLAVTYPFKTIMISTNGSPLTEEMMDEFVKSDKFRIQFSFCGWDKRSYESRYVGGDFEKTKNKISMIIEKIKKAGLPNVLTINGAASKSTGAINKTKEFLKKEFGLDERQMKIHNQNNWIEVLNNKTQENKNSPITYCHIANTRIGVLYDGKITACGCLDVNGELIIGNIAKDSLKGIRKKDAFVDFTRKLNEGKTKGLMCNNCDSLKEIIIKTNNP